jgi:putative membrane protein insertion efficiency factor
MGIVKAYRLLLSPWLGSACRFEPSCSVYALGALDQHGAARGSYLTLKRLARCHPWCDGGHDPVPHAKVKADLNHDKRLFSRLVSSHHSSSPKKSS